MQLLRLWLLVDAKSIAVYKLTNPYSFLKFYLSHKDVGAVADHLPETAIFAGNESRFTFEWLDRVRALSKAKRIATKVATSSSGLDSASADADTGGSTEPEGGLITSFEDLARSLLIGASSGIPATDLFKEVPNLLLREKLVASTFRIEAESKQNLDGDLESTEKPRICFGLWISSPAGLGNSLDF